MLWRGMPFEVLFKYDCAKCYSIMFRCGLLCPGCMTFHPHAMGSITTRARYSTDTTYSCAKNKYGGFARCQDSSWHHDCYRIVTIVYCCPANTCCAKDTYLNT